MRTVQRRATRPVPPPLPKPTACPVCGKAKHNFKIPATRADAVR